MALITYAGRKVAILNATYAGVLVNIGPIEPNPNPPPELNPSLFLPYSHPGYQGIFALLLDSFQNQREITLEVSDQLPPAHGAIFATIESVFSRYPK